jgi:hypothetical protein
MFCGKLGGRLGGETPSRGAGARLACTQPAAEERPRGGPNSILDRACGPSPGCGFGYGTARGASASMDSRRRPEDPDAPLTPPSTSSGSATDAGALAGRSSTTRCATSRAGVCITAGAFGSWPSTASLSGLSEMPRLAGLVAEVVSQEAERRPSPAGRRDGPVPARSDARRRRPRRPRRPERFHGAAR